MGISLTTLGMNIDPSGTFLYAANQNTDNIGVFRIDPTSGMLQFNSLVNTPTPVDVEFGWPKAILGSK